MQGENISAGQTLDKGTVVGRLFEGGCVTLLVTHCKGIFLGWLVSEGDRVSPGRAIARFMTADE